MAASSQGVAGSPDEGMKQSGESKQNKIIDSGASEEGMIAFMKISV